MKMNENCRIMLVTLKKEKYPMLLLRYRQDAGRACIYVILLSEH